MMSGQQTLTQQTLAAHTASKMSNARTVAFTAINPKQYVLAAGASVLWEPSVYGGTGAEKRLNIVLKVSEETRAAVQAIEDTTLGAVPGLCSVIREDTIRCKLDVDELRFWDHNNDRTQAPDNLKGAVVQAYIEIRGTWTSRTGAGLSIMCTDLQFDGEAAPALSPFSARLAQARQDMKQMQGTA